jgi:hypothetical protein
VAAEQAGEVLLVQNARKFTSEGETITLHGVAATLYFADGPRREVGHLQTRELVELWSMGANSLVDDPPHAVLTFFDRLLPREDLPPENVVVVLRNPRLHGDALTYSVEILDGVLPAETGGCTLFIDVAGRPDGPLAVAGAWQRAVRPY